METIDVNELHEMMTQGDEFMLINVLDEENFHEHHIPGSRNVPVNTPNFAERVEQMAGDKHRTIVVYCANTECSASPTAAKKLEHAGFTNVLDFEGGIEAW
ncbi:MAG: rhodanese-like domain-containing protein [Phycisphaeraceae bacterium]